MRIATAALLLMAALGLSAAPKKIVLVSGDEEYRTEESFPQLAKILEKHGFRCVVLYAIDPADGTINPNVQTNLPGLEALDDADLMVMGLRFRDLPDAQMKHIVDYVEAGKPIVALRTSTHAFQLKSSPTYAKWSWNNKEWDGGFGRQVLGETWIRHHGKHAVQSTRGVFAPGAVKHPILKGIKDGAIWGPSDVYAAKLPLPGDSVPLVLGQVLEGMKEGDKAVEGPVNDPMMPVAWVKTYKGGRVFTTTMGAATDLENEAMRRLVVNGIYWAMGLEKKIKAKLDVGLVGEYKPSAFKFNGFIKGRKP